MKNSFIYDEFKATYDWYEVVCHVIEWSDYNYFVLERRYGPSWWIRGVRYVNESHSYFKDEIGEICVADLLRFIEWAKTDHGSKILSIEMISGEFDIFNEICDLIVDKQKNP